MWWIATLHRRGKLLLGRWWSVQMGVIVKTVIRRQSILSQWARSFAALHVQLNTTSRIQQSKMALLLLQMKSLTVWNRRNCWEVPESPSLMLPWGMERLQFANNFCNNTCLEMLECWPFVSARGCAVSLPLASNSMIIKWVSFGPSLQMSIEQWFVSIRSTKWPVTNMTKLLIILSLMNVCLAWFTFSVEHSKAASPSLCQCFHYCSAERRGWVFFFFIPVVKKTNC